MLFSPFFFNCGILYNRNSFNSLSKRFVVVIVSTHLALSDISCICFHFCPTHLSDIYCGFFCIFCRTHLALSDISCVLLSFLSDTSSCGHIWLCRTYALSSRNKADVMNRLDVTEHLRRQMHEMRSLLESALPCLGSPGGQSRTPSQQLHHRNKRRYHQLPVMASRHARCLSIRCFNRRRAMRLQDRLLL